jgi:hypothetical protein
MSVILEVQVKSSKGTNPYGTQITRCDSDAPQPGGGMVKAPTVRGHGVRA